MYLDPETSIATFSAPQNWFGEETIEFTVRDPEGLSDTEPVMFTLIGVNDAPVLSQLPDQTLDEDGQRMQAIDLWSYARDWETPTPELTFRIHSVSSPEVGVILEGNRYVSITPKANWFGLSEVTIEITDPEGLSDTNRSVDEGPIEETVGLFSLLEGQTIEYYSVDPLGNTEARHRYTHLPETQDPFLEPIASPRLMPLVRLTGRSSQNPLHLQLRTPSGEETEIAIPAGEGGDFSHHQMLSEKEGAYLLSPLLDAPDEHQALPVEVVLSQGKFSLNTSIPLTLADLRGDGGLEVFAATCEARIVASSGYAAFSRVAIFSGE